jgi:hypothetical protein
MKLGIPGAVMILVALLLVGVTLALGTSHASRTGAVKPLTVASAALSPDGPPACCTQ